jgi:hypothetical protein
MLVAPNVSDEGWIAMETNSWSRAQLNKATTMESNTTALKHLARREIITTPVINSSSARQGKKRQFSSCFLKLQAFYDMRLALITRI